MTCVCVCAVLFFLWVDVNDFVLVFGCLPIFYFLDFVFCSPAEFRCSSLLCSTSTVL